MTALGDVAIGRTAMCFLPRCAGSARARVAATGGFARLRRSADFHAGRGLGFAARATFGRCSTFGRFMAGNNFNGNDLLGKALDFANVEVFEVIDEGDRQAIADRRDPYARYGVRSLRQISVDRS